MSKGMNSFIISLTLDIDTSINTEAKPSLTSFDDWCFYRKKRIEEYKRAKTIEKIEMDSERTRVLQKVKSDMIQEVCESIDFVKTLLLFPHMSVCVCVCVCVCSESETT